MVLYHTITTIFQTYLALKIFILLIGFISKEEFEEACRVLNNFNDEEGTPNSSISDLAKALDINKDGKIDFNEFLEAFRLVNNSIEEKSKSFTSVNSWSCLCNSIFASMIPFLYYPHQLYIILCYLLSEPQKSIRVWLQWKKNLVNSRFISDTVIHQMILNATILKRGIVIWTCQSWPGIWQVVLDLL